VDNRDEVRAFLSSRRAKVTPEQAGLAYYGRNRRVPGLRRSEVADLAGVSVEYYAQLERGNLSGVSESVLDALGRALHLNEAEREHLADLARAAGPTRRARRRPTARQVRPSVARILEGMTEVPAFVENGRLDVLAANPLGRALYAPVFADPARPSNLARFNFLNPHARTFWGDWERAADDTVAMLRT
jgi:transcriptional regulator with XRE-family HTH domain